MQMTRTHYHLLFLVFLTVYSPQPIFASTSDCYGDTLEVELSLHTGTPAGLDTIILSLPNPDLWGGNPIDSDVPWKQTDCLSEPVRMSSVYSSGMQNKFQRALELPPAALDKVFAIRIGSKPVGARTSTERRYENNKNETEWLEIPYGFSKLVNGDDEFINTRLGRTFVYGFFTFPEQYKTPLGLPVRTLCLSFGSCKIDYSLNERMTVQYDFWSSLDYQNKWIQQDQAVRDFIDSLIISN